MKNTNQTTIKERVRKLAQEQTKKGTPITPEEWTEFQLFKLHYEMNLNRWHEATTDEQMAEAIEEVRKARKRLDEIRLKFIDNLVFTEEEKQLFRNTLKNIIQVKKLDNIILAVYQKKEA